jgi:hypothetical protein
MAEFLCLTQFQFFYSLYAISSSEEGPHRLTGTTHQGKRTRVGQKEKASD